MCVGPVDCWVCRPQRRMVRLVETGPPKYICYIGDEICIKIRITGLLWRNPDRIIFWFLIQANRLII